MQNAGSRLFGLRGDQPGGRELSSPVQTTGPERAAVLPHPVRDRRATQGDVVTRCGTQNLLLWQQHKSGLGLELPTHLQNSHPANLVLTFTARPQTAQATACGWGEGKNNYLRNSIQNFRAPCNQSWFKSNHSQEQMGAENIKPACREWENWKLRVLFISCDNF